MKHIINIEKGKPIDYVRLDDVLRFVDKYFNEKPKEEFIIIANTEQLSKFMVAIGEELKGKLKGEIK